MRDLQKRKEERERERKKINCFKRSNKTETPFSPIPHLRRSNYFGQKNESSFLIKSNSPNKKKEEKKERRREREREREREGEKREKDLSDAIGNQIRQNCFKLS